MSTPHASPQRPARSPITDPDIIVVGAGFAGVAAATLLAERGARVLVLETRQRPGGRAYSWTDPATGEVRDNGQHVLASFYDETHRLLGRLGTADALAADPAFRLRVEVRHRGGYEVACPPWPAPFNWARAIMGAGGLSMPSRLAALGLQGRIHSLLARNGSGADTTIQSWLSDLGRGTEDLEGLLWALAIAALNDVPGEASATLFARVLGRLLAAPSDRTGLAMPRRALGDLIAGFEDYLAARGGEVRYRATALGTRIDGDRITGVSLLGGAPVNAGAVILTVPHERITWMLRPEFAGPYRDIAVVPWSPIVSTMHVFDRPVLPERMVALLGTRTQWAFDRGEAGTDDSGWEPCGAPHSPTRSGTSTSSRGRRRRISSKPSLARAPRAFSTRACTRSAAPRCGRPRRRSACDPERRRPSVAFISRVTGPTRDFHRRSREPS